MDIIDPLAENYIENLSTAHSGILQQILADTNANHPHAHMVSGAVQGKVLQMLSRMIQPEKVLEIGTFTGFSALCMAEGIQPGGELHTIELRAEDAFTAKQYFEKSNYKDVIKLHVGDAKKIIPTLLYEWDIVFIDADKTSYIEYYELTLPQLKKNGYMLADNVLFHGQVFHKPISGKNAKAIHDFNLYVANDPRTEQVILSIRDGISIIRKV